MAKAKTINKAIVGEMPHSLEAEQALLGCLLMDTRTQIEISAYLKEEDFYAESTDSGRYRKNCENYFRKIRNNGCQFDGNIIK